MLLIKYNFWCEHPIGKGVSFFIGFLVLAFGFINVMTMGLYGYAMGMDNLWFLVFCVLFLGANMQYGKHGEGWVVNTCLFGIKIKSQTYADAKLQTEGKLFRMYFLSKGKYIPSPIAFNSNATDLVKLVLEKN